jgi:two-component system, probable response regulator PhcQ
MTPSDPGSSLLLLDDEPAIVAALQRSLRAHWPRAIQPLRLQGFTDAHAALGHLLTHPVDVVVCDYRMPAMDGIDFLRRVRSLQPDAGRVLLTGTPDLDAVLRAVNEAGAERVLLKPWHHQELVAVLVRSRADSRQRRSVAAHADAWRVAQGELDAAEAERRRSAVPEVITIQPSLPILIPKDLP